MAMGSAKVLLVVAGAAAVAVGAAVLVLRGPGAGVNAAGAGSAGSAGAGGAGGAAGGAVGGVSGAAALVVPGLAASAEKAAVIEVTGPSGSGGSGGMLRVEKDAEGVWRVLALSGYAAEFAKVRALVLGLSDLAIAERKTAKPENHASLGLKLPAEGDAGGGGEAAGAIGEDAPTRVRLLDSGGGVLADVVLGKRAAGTEGMFVRLASADQTYRSTKSVSASVDAKSWIDRSALQVARDQVRRVEIVHADGERFEVSRGSAEETDFVLSPVPEGKEPDAAYRVNAVAGVLAYPSVEDVRKADDAAVAAAAVQATLTVELFEGMAVRAEVRKEESGRFWVVASAEATAMVSEAVEAFNRKAEGWAFAVPEYSAQAMTTRVATLVRDAEAPAVVIPPAEDEAGPALPEVVETGEAGAESGAESGVGAEEGLPPEAGEGTGVEPGPGR